MSVVITSILGILFFVLGTVATFLMFYLWGFPFDKATRTSAAPKSLMRLHRVVGFAYVFVYVVMMTQMVPRMWQYQVELPTRTVIHLCLGFLVGIILILKISILRFFRHLEEWMPALGTTMFVCTVLLLALSLPFVGHERSLADANVFGAQNRARVADLLTQNGLTDGTPAADLASESSLRSGRSVLLEKCIRCHDLKTVLERPRVPSEWAATVARMADKPSVFAPITNSDKLHVTAYLVAITPGLQKSAKDKRQSDGHASATVAPAVPQSAGLTTAVDPAVAKATFEKVCSQCHAISEVDQSPPKSAAEVDALIQRMRGNGMKASDSDIQKIRFHLTKTYVKAP